MRIPHPKTFPSPPSNTPPSIKSINDAITALQHFLREPAVVLTGAGLSVASKLSDYRGPNGTYTTRPTFRPILLSEYLSLPSRRKQYWSRSFLGYDDFNDAKPNSGHRAIASLMKMGRVRGVITQNVDSLHLKALEGILGEGESIGNWTKGSVEGGRAYLHEKGICELHGALRSVICYECHTPFPGGRTGLQEFLREKNPFWEELKLNGKLIYGPDGDVAPAEDVQLPPFIPPPPCGNCGGLLKPGIVFFGENVPIVVREFAEKMLDETGRVIVLASSLATLSAWRLVRRVQERWGSENVAVVTMGGIRDEGVFFGEGRGVRVEADVQVVLKGLMERMEERVLLNGSR